MMDTEESELSQGLSEEELASQVVEIISGISRGALRSLEEAVEVAVVSLEEEEEGDDSVFYDEEDQASLDTKEATPWPLGARQRGDTSLFTPPEEAGGAHGQRENTTGAGLITYEEPSQAQREASDTHQDTQADADKEHQEPQSTRTEPMKEHPSIVADPGLGQTLNLEEPLNTCGESLEVNNTPAGSQTQPEQSTQPEKGVVEDMTSSPQQQQTEVQTPEVASPKDDKDIILDVHKSDVEALEEQASSDELQVSAESQGELDPLEPQKDHHHSQSSMLSPHDATKPSYSSLPPAVKSGRTVGRKKSFDHHTSSRYNTVSYRKIRRGNTRQKIAEFESMIINL